MEVFLALPNLVELSPHQLGFLDEHFKTREDLSMAAPLATELKKNCVELDRNLINLQKNLSGLISSWISRSNGTKRVLHQLNLKLLNFGLYPSPGEMGIVGLKQIRKILREELPLLVKELRRIDTVRDYAETTLHLEALVGDLEDAVFLVMKRNTRNIFSENLLNESSPPDFGWKQEKLLLAVKAMNNIEKVILNVAKCQPQWKHLLKSVDARVDKTLGVLRPQALADHRALLASLGWPPPLLTSETEIGKNLGLPNPLVLMQGDKRERYSQSFLALCALQHLQCQREARQLDLLGHKREHNLGLWTIDELVSPIASRAEHHFSKWADQPKFMFALVYKITRDFVVGVDDVLQPLIDKARLVGCSAKEAWVSAMVKMLSGYLAKRILSVLAERYKEKNAKSEVIALWLHLVDLIVAFDNQMQSLVSLGTPLFVGESSRFEEIPGGVSALSIFCDRPDWLRIWAKIELKDAQKKLKLELEDDRAWLIDTKKGAEFHTEREPEQFLLSTREDHKAPPIAEAVIKITWEMIQRCKTLPSILLQAQYIRLSAAKFLWKFFKVLLQHCKEAEFTTGHVEDDALMTISLSIDAARYCEFILREWSEDVNFLEMKMAEDDSNIWIKNEMDDHSCFFGEHIESLIELETDWLMEIMANLLCQFNTLTLEHVQNREQWEREDLGLNIVWGATDLTVSADFVEALDVLRSQFHILKAHLNQKDFLDLWRSIADGLDQFIFGSIIMSDTRFSGQGVSQFGSDMRALFVIFQSFSTRPEAFFPCIRDSLKLLEMCKEDVRHLQAYLSNNEKRRGCLRLYGILHISPDQAEKILRNRKFVA